MVCSCNQVREGTLAGLIKDGCTDLGKLCSISGAGIDCGSCRPEIQRLLEEHLVEEPV
ncbi:MAG TPA: hypothetical protein EYQ64_06280 [Gemmatimonadetes bacterium]|nr:hypothetical protein [Gemmatimonadota bacterium]